MQRSILVLFLLLYLTISAVSHKQQLHQYPKDSLIVSVKMDTNVVIQGKMFFIDIILENTSNRDLYVARHDVDLKCVHLEENFELYTPFYFAPSHIEIKAKNKFIRYHYPVSYIRYDDSSKGGWGQYGYIPEYWLAGNYRFIADIAGERRELDFTILPLPDSLKEEFDGIWRAKTLKEKEAQAKKHIGSFFEEEYYHQFARDNFSYYSVTEKNYGPEEVKKGQDIYKEFILRYPDNGYSEYFLDVLKSREYNKVVVKEIVDQLKEKEKKRSKPSRTIEKIKVIFPELLK